MLDGSSFLYYLCKLPTFDNIFLRQAGDGDAEEEEEEE